jgi:ankyrin repeat protein
MAVNKKMNVIIGISIALAAVVIHFGGNKNRNNNAEWENFLMENSSRGSGETLDSEEASRMFAQNCNSVSPTVYKQLQRFNLNYAYETDKGETLWHLCQKSHMWTTLVPLIKAANVSMESPNKEGRTPWLSAIVEDDGVAAKWFKDNGANTAAVDTSGNPAWFLAGVRTHDALRMWGLEKTDTRNLSGQNDLIYALSNKRNERARKLFDMGPDLGIRDRSGKIALHYAASSGNSELTLAIVQRNPEYLYIEDSRHKKPVDLATGNTRSILREYLNTSTRYE